MIREATMTDVRPFITFMKRFETCTEHVKVDVEHSITNYARFIEDGRGHILILCDDDTGEFQGGLGFIVTEDLHYPRSMAIETFWYVGEEFRGQGAKLFIAFEEWCTKNDIQVAAMIHLSDSYPESLEKFYIRNGYKLVEKHYVKELRP